VNTASSTLISGDVLGGQVRGLEKRLDGASNTVRVQQIKVDQLQQQLDELRSQLQQTQAAEANLEGEAQGTEQRIAKLREQMNSAKTNKEYSAFLVEVNTLKADKSQSEESALELMTQIEQLKERVAEAETKLADQIKIKEMAEKELADRKAEVGEQLAAVKKQRAEAAAKVPDDALNIFDRLADDLDGEAMAPVTLLDRRRMECTCGACHMSIPVEYVNQLYSTDNLIRCTSCHRILYLEEEMKASLGGD